MALISSGDLALLKSDKGTIRSARIDDKRVSLGKRSFFLHEAMGKPYGTTFEVHRDQLVAVEKPKTDVLSEGIGEDYESGIDNRAIKDDNQSQKLTRDDIVALKAQGAKADEIIGQLVENSGTFKERTEYSQAKYIRKKQLRYEDDVTIVRPSARLVCEMCLHRNPLKILHMRIDTLSQILALSNVHSGSNVLLVENCQGLVSGAVLQRLGGKGKLIQFSREAVPVRPALEAFGLSGEVLEPLEDFPLDEIGKLGWASVETKEEKSGVETKEDTLGKRKRKIDHDEDDRHQRKKIRLEQVEQTRRFIEANKMDSLIVASKFQPWPIVESLICRLAPSRPFVIYSQHKESLVECFVNFRDQNLAVAMQLSETWFRHYQVFPQRTRPEMNGKRSGGYLLTGTTTCSKE